MNRPSISHETIYFKTYADKKDGGNLHLNLRHKAKSYRNRSLTQDKRGKIRNAPSIDERPAVVDERSRLGDWEMDTIIGRASGSVLVTMVRPLPHRSKLHTLTFDNVKELADHAIIDGILRSASYLAHAYNFWERGLNEQTNGLIRQFFPKGTDFDRITESQIEEVEQKLNSRPRKCLERETPATLFFKN